MASWIYLAELMLAASSGERALGSLSCAFVVHGRLLSLQRLKTNRLPKPADQAPLIGCQHFCLWTGYHLAPRAVPRKRGLRSQSLAESPICRPWKSQNGREGEKKGGNFYYFSLIIKLQRSLTTL